MKTIPINFTSKFAADIRKQNFHQIKRLKKESTDVVIIARASITLPKQVFFNASLYASLLTLQEY